MFYIRPMTNELQELLTHPEIILYSDRNLLSRSVYCCGISNITGSPGSIIPKPKYGKSCRSTPCNEKSFVLWPCSIWTLCCSAFQSFSYCQRPVDKTSFKHSGSFGKPLRNCKNNHADTCSSCSRPGIWCSHSSEYVIVVFQTVTLHSLEDGYLPTLPFFIP